jgi:putative tryptophan/tyrosine transport system substrate-binding protein
MEFLRRRRQFITILGGAAAWPLAARAQQTGKVYRIGFLANDPAIPMQPAGQAFLDGLREGGFIEGGNIIIERRFAEARPDRYGKLVAELIQLDVDVLVTSAEEATLAAKRATTKIPIVMMNVSDPVGHRRELGPSRRQHHRCDPGRFGGNCRQADAAPQGCHSARCQGVSSD